MMMTARWEGNEPILWPRPLPEPANYRPQRDTHLCRCGHARAEHNHHRAGTDCSAKDCPCTTFTRRWFTNRKATT